MKTKKPALAHGFILSIVLLLNSLMPIIIQDYKTSFFQWSGFIILVGGTAICCWLFGKDNNHELKFGKLFSHGFKTAIIAGIISTLIMVVLYKFVFPNEIVIQREIAIEKLRTDPSTQKLQASQLEAAESITNKMFDNFISVLVFMGVIFSALIGLIGALLGAIITSKKNANVFPKDSEPEPEKTMQAIQEEPQP